MSANPHANGGVLRIPLRLPDFGAYAVPVTHARRVSSAGHADPRPVPAGRHAGQHGQLPGLWSRRNGVQPPASHLRSQQEDVARRIQARGRRWRRARAGRTRHGNAQRAHARRLGRRLRPDRPPCVLRVLRSVLPHHRFDGQPAREVAGEVQDRGEMAGVHSVLESAGDVDRVAAGPQRLYAPGSRASSMSSRTRARSSPASISRPTRTVC